MEHECCLISEVIFYAGARGQLPGPGYRPDAVFAGIHPEEYWGITFIRLSATAFDTPTVAEIKFTFQAAHCRQVEIGQSFQIMEGPRQVGQGKILGIRCGEQT